MYELLNQRKGISIMEKKKSLFWLVICVFFLVTTYSCGESLSDKEKREAKEEQLQLEKYNKKIMKVRKQVISSFKNAIFFPPKDFKNEDEKVFTYTLQKLFLSKEGMPIVFDGYLDDISKKGTQFFIDFTGFVGEGSFDHAQIKFHLKCNYEDIKPLIENKINIVDDDLLRAFRGKEGAFLVVCKVSNVTKINYAVHGYSPPEEVVKLEIETPDVFSVNGKLIKMVMYPKRN